MGAPENFSAIAELVGVCRAPALAAALLAMTRYAEQPSWAAAQTIACHLDCVADDEDCDAATRAIGALLSRCWLYGERTHVA